MVGVKRRWIHADLSSIAISVPWPINASCGPSAYVTPDGIARVLSSGFAVEWGGYSYGNQDVQELRLQPGQGWVDADLTSVSVNGGDGTHGDTPYGYVTPNDLVPRVVYVGDDSDVHEFHLQPGQGWSNADLTQLGNGVPASSTQAYPYVTPDHVPRVVYVSFSGLDTLFGDIHELRLPPGQGWTDANLSSLAGVTPPGSIIPSTASANPNLAPFAYVTPDSIPRVLYFGFDNHVHELRLQPGQGWVHADLSQLANAPDVNHDNSEWYHAYIPNAYVTPDSVPRVVYLADDWHVHELRLEPGKPWTQSDLTSEANAPAAYGDPFGYVPKGIAGESIPRVVYQVLEDDGSVHIHELRLEPEKPWQYADLSSLAGAPSMNLQGYPPLGDRPFAYVTPDGTPRVIYSEYDTTPSVGGTIHELRLYAELVVNMSSRHIDGSPEMSAYGRVGSRKRA